MTEEKRRPGRPANLEPSDETAHIDVRLSPDLRRQVRIAAAKTDASMNNWVKRAIEEKLKRDGAASDH